MERGKKARRWMCSGVRRGGEANNAIRELASVSQAHTHTHTHVYCTVCLYLSQLFTHRRQQRKTETEENSERQRQKKKGVEKWQRRREEWRREAAQNDGLGKANCGRRITRGRVRGVQEEVES